MAILLRRNSKKDANFSMSNNLLIEGDIVNLIEVDNKYANTGMPASILIRFSKYRHPLWANLDCYDYVRRNNG